MDNKQIGIYNYDRNNMQIVLPNFLILLWYAKSIKTTYYCVKYVLHV